MSNLRPNLFIVGAMKSGTSAFHNILNAHPEIFMSNPKEPCHFVNRYDLKKYWPEMEEQGYWQEKKYLSLFDNSQGFHIRGESSTDYSKLPYIKGVPERISKFNPNSKIIYIMRDPVERTISHYWHAIKKGEDKRDIMTALMQSSIYMDASNYAAQLKPYIEIFGSKNIMAFTLEEFNDHPEVFLRNIFIWLGVKPIIIDINIVKERVHVTPEVLEIPKDIPIIKQLRSSRIIKDMLQTTLPDKMQKSLKKMFNVRIVRKDIDAGQMRKLLRPVQLEQTEELCKLLNRQFPEWKTLYEDK